MARKKKKDGGDEGALREKEELSLPFRKATMDFKRRSVSVVLSKSLLIESPALLPLALQSPGGKTQPLRLLSLPLFVFGSTSD